MAAALRTSSLVALGAAALAPSFAAAEIFVHYMVQGLDGTTDHASQDVTDALSLGFDGFALNVGQPGEGWNDDCIAQLFAAAEGTEFKFFFSLDLYQRPSPYDFNDLIAQYWDHANYFRGGDNGSPMLSTFSAGEGSDPAYWPDWKASLPGDVFFVPNFDQTEGYYTDIEGWLSAWGDVPQGTFSWETAWPGTQDTATNVSSSDDEYVMSGVHAASKAYMMPLSSLQYKHFSGSHWYRVGEGNLPQRMTQILGLADKPEFVQVQTWNDAGESHYIGKLWSEGLTDEILTYANQDEHPHNGWGPLFASFNAAFKAGASDASAMVPQEDGVDVAGAMWYRELLADADCSSDSAGKPEGSGAALDAINWAVVVAEGVEGLKGQSWSNGELIKVTPLSTGLNYGSDGGVKAGIQYFEVVDASGNIVISGQGGKEVKSASTDFCTYNFQVAGLA